MRWKWLLLITLVISLTALTVQGTENDGEEEKVAVESESEKPQEENEDDENYDDDENGENDEHKDPVDAEPSEDVNIMAAEESTNEDAVDVGSVSENKKKGRYYNYDDYLASAVDGSDSGYDWNNPLGRVAPNEPPTHRNDGQGYSISPERLRQIRREFMYWYFDQGGPENHGDLQRDIHASNQQVHKNFNFQLPFFGFRFNYTRVSLNGQLEFSDPPEHYTYPLVFPIKDWPRRNDPSFIGIFFSRCRIGRIYQTDYDQRAPGVYFRQERDLMTRTDRFGVEVRERVMWDIREGVVGSDTFIPKHVVIVTWKNMSFAGGIDNSLFRTNSFQLVLATDEVYTYAIMNYADITWSSHTEAGGDTTGGEGGVPAYIGFNAGNGTQSYEYKPYSQASVLRDLTGRGWANGFPGRHIFRIDERIMLGTCNKDIDAAHLPLVFAPESGNMLGGTIVNITGPCFRPTDRISCRFDTTEVVGTFVDTNRAICIQPPLLIQGYVRFEIRIGAENYKWRGQYFVETPATATDRIFFETQDVHERNPSEIKITWTAQNLTSNLNAIVRISLYGYRESTIKPELEFITVIEEQTMNTGAYTIAPANFRTRSNNNLTDLQFGFLHISLVNPEQMAGLSISPVLWSKPIPLAWYFGPQWERMHGLNWPRALCDNWLRMDRFLRNFAHEVPVCPCTLDQALTDKGRFMPDFDCDRDANPTCMHHRGGIHCVRSGTPTQQGSEQQCCYDRNRFLMLSHDQMWGSRPRRTHNAGMHPWNEANKVPTLSQWFHDIRAYYSCCRWQGEQAVGCETFRFERRPSQDCVAYQAPGVASIFGDPHVVTFDNLQYTFNGMGEFVLVRGRAGSQTIDVQGRFEQVARNIHGPVMATHLTSVAMRGSNTTVIEVRVRPRDAQWRYRLDVFADGRRIYFDRQSLKFQFFQGVTVYTPSYILNQSEVVIMFASGAGVEIVENSGFMTARVYLPWQFINKTRGLFGNWSFDMTDDLVTPDGNIVPTNLNNFEIIHRDFGMRWMLSDRETPGVGAGLFTREFGRTASYYANATFRPNFIREPDDFLPRNRTQDIERARDLCGESYQCRFDYGMSLHRDMAHFTRNYYDSAVNIAKNNRERILSCGILETPRFGRKSNFQFTPGAVVTFECNEGFYLNGDRRRMCLEDGRWDVPQSGYTECLREVFFTRYIVWITIFVILLVILPMIMCIVCVVYQYRKKQLEKDPNYTLPIPHSRSGSRTTLKNMRSDESEADDHSIAKVRRYDGSYETHEPLKDKPDVNFEAKKMDLDEEDFTSSEGSAAHDPARQTGRRTQRMESDYKPIEEEDNSGRFPPPPVESPQPYNGTYSPTFSFNSNTSPTPAGAVRVFPLAQAPKPPTTQPPQQQQPQTSRFYDAPISPISPASPVSPNLSQNVGLPQDGRSTQV